MDKCLICYKEKRDDSTFYHSKCYAKSILASYEPMVPYRLDEIDALVRKVIQQRFSIPGVQVKISLGDHVQQGAGKLTIVGYNGRFILKPQSSKWPELPENEDATMKCAREAGMPVVPQMLVPMVSGERAYITERIDRQDDGKIHMEDMAQASGRLTEHKYQGSVESVAKLIYRYSENKMFDVVTFFERVLFSFITGNSDMHLKNYAFIYRPDGIALAPAYDLLNTRIVTKDMEESALTINGKKNKIGIDDFEKAGSTMLIPEKAREKLYGKYSSMIPRFCEIVQSGFLSDVMKTAYCETIHTARQRLQL